KAGAAPLLGRKHRLEDQVELLVFDPLAAVGQFDQRVGAIAQRPHAQFAAVGHGVQAVVDEVDEDLLQLVRVGSNHRQAFAHLDQQLDVAGDQRRLRRVEDAREQRVQIDEFKLRLRPAGRVQHRAHDVSNPFNLSGDDIQPFDGALVGGAGAQQLDVPGDQIERRADFVSELRRQLAGGGEAFELSQLALHLEQLQVRVFELFFALGNLGRGLFDAVGEYALFEVQLLGHLPYATEHAVEARGEQADLVRRLRRDFGRQVARLGLRHRQQQAI